jgi:hypothetical protein
MIAIVAVSIVFTIVARLDRERRIQLDRRRIAAELQKARAERHKAIYTRTKVQIALRKYERDGFQGRLQAVPDIADAEENRMRAKARYEEVSRRVEKVPPADRSPAEKQELQKAISDLEQARSRLIELDDHYKYAAIQSLLAELDKIGDDSVATKALIDEVNASLARMRR